MAQTDDLIKDASTEILGSMAGNAIAHWSVPYGISTLFKNTSVHIQDGKRTENTPTWSVKEKTLSATIC